MSYNLDTKRTHIVKRNMMQSMFGKLRKVKFFKHLCISYKAILAILLILSVIYFLFFWLSNGPHTMVGNANPSNNSDTNEFPGYGAANFKIYVPKIKIKAPIIRGVNPTDENIYDEALKDGVAHMVGTPLPGTGKGNIFIYGHSGEEDKSTYEKIFSGLDNLVFGDEIIIYYNKIEFRYIVNEKRFIEKDDFSVLEQTEDERVTLMTCWPIGASDLRLVVVAKRK